MTVKKDLILEGLDCAHCASKIECEVAALQGVSAANLNFATKTLMVEADAADGDIGEILLRTGEIIKKHEPDVTVKERVLDRPVLKAYLLVGLDCATCAAKIEKEVRQIEGVKSATVDFVTGRMTIEAHRRHDMERIGKQAAAIARRVESGVKVVDNEEKKPKEAEGKTSVLKYVLLGVGAALFLVAYAFSLPQWARLPLFLVGYALVGGNVLLSAGRNILKGKVFDENFLMSVATIGAFAIGEYPEAVAVMLFYQVGELLQGLAVNRSRKSISALMDIRPDSANLKTGDSVTVVAPEDVHPGQFIIVKPGERVPLDGKVAEGRSALNASALTGEARPVDVGPGDSILSGCINLNGVLTVEVTKEFGESTMAKILDMVQNASSKKAPSENFITKFARYYTPAVVFAALALAVVPPLFAGFDTFFMWLNRALIFLVVSCPCALVISIPLSFFGGIGGASRRGILVKGGNYLDALNRVDTVVFDKTGTLTKGVFQVTGIEPANGFTGEQLLELAAFAECYSTHPIAASILKAYGREVDRGRIEGIDELSGFGVKAKVGGKEILAGNQKLLQAQNIPYTAAAQPGTVIHVAIDGVYGGSIVIADEIKSDARRAVEDLRKLGIGKLVMLTGDSKPIAEQVGKQLSLDEVHAELLPGQKVEKLELLQKQTRGKLLFVGDGINDAPVLARADVGVAMGGLGSDAAIEAADIVLMTDEPTKLAAAIGVARRTRAIVMQNIIFALGVKGILLALSAFGAATMWEAVFADVGVTLIAVLNSMRVMRGK